MRTVKFRGKIEGNWWYVTPESGSWEQFWSLADEKTIGQFTDLHDRSGKEIYKGDICRMLQTKGGSLATTYEVYWNEDRWGLRNGDEDYDNGDYYHGDVIDWKEAEVIGNVYEHHELLTA